nr:glycosyltransferase [Peribacillus kribbensis]
MIPVYNAEQYLPACIESLINQSLNECEFIFVNDGSIDDSEKVINEYRQKDSRILLINQENQGVSAARNHGLELAGGEYVGFVDADDYVEESMYEILHNAAQKDNCDIVLSNLKGRVDGRSHVTKYKFPAGITLDRSFIKREVLPYLIKEDNLNSVCNKLFKRDLIQEFEIRFPVGVPLGEDGIFNLMFFNKAGKMKYIDSAGYFYREVTGSATRDLNGKDYFYRALEVYRMDLKELSDIEIQPELIQQFKQRKLIKNVLSFIHLYLEPSNKISLFKSYRYIKNMLSSREVQKALPMYCEVSHSSLGRYERFVLNMMIKKSFIGLYWAAAYSRFRNK